MSNMVVSKKEQKELMEAFQALDLDGNGTLTYEELIEGYKKIYPKKSIQEVEVIVQNIMDKIDVNGSGQIDFSEFIVASMSQATLLHSSSIQTAFKLFDVDGDGFIDRKELKLAMGGMNLSDKEWDKLIEQYDTNGDGKVALNNIDID